MRSVAAFLSGSTKVPGSAYLAPAPRAALAPHGGGVRQQYRPLTPVEREWARQQADPGAGDAGDLNGGDDKTEKTATRIPNGIGGVGGRSGVMSYHGGKIVANSLQVYLIMCAPTSPGSSPPLHTCT